MKSWHLAVLALAILASAGIILFKNNSSSATQTKTATATVLLKADSFEPETLTVKKGATVEFKNVDKDPHWPASDIHPTHTIYPEFDPLKPIEPDQSWFFSFNKVGRWKDHDHLVPSTRGTIIVTE